MSIGNQAKAPKRYEVTSVLRSRAGRVLSRLDVWEGEADSAKSALIEGHRALVQRLLETGTLQSMNPPDSIATQVRGPGGETVSTTDFVDDLLTGHSSVGLMQERDDPGFDYVVADQGALEHAAVDALPESVKERARESGAIRPAEPADPIRRFFDEDGHALDADDGWQPAQTIRGTMVWSDGFEGPVRCRFEWQDFQDAVNVIGGPSPGYFQQVVERHFHREIWTVAQHLANSQWGTCDDHLGRWSLLALRSDRVEGIACLSEAQMEFRATDGYQVLEHTGWVTL